MLVNSKTHSGELSISFYNIKMEYDSHLPLWRCEGTEAVKVKSEYSTGSLVLSRTHF